MKYFATFLWKTRTGYCPFMMRRPLTIGAIIFAFGSSVGAPGGLSAQGQVIQTAPNRGGTTTSMGLPPTWRWSLGGTTGIHRVEGQELTFYLNAGVYKDLLAPVTAGLGLLFEGYAGRRGSFETFGTGFDGGFRISARKSPSSGQKRSP